MKTNLKEPIHHGNLANAISRRGQLSQALDNPKSQVCWKSK